MTTKELLDLLQRAQEWLDAQAKKEKEINPKKDDPFNIKPK